MFDSEESFGPDGIFRGGIPRAIGNFPEAWTQGFLVCGLAVANLVTSGVSFV